MEFEEESFVPYDGEQSLQDRETQMSPVFEVESVPPQITRSRVSRKHSILACAIMLCTFAERIRRRKNCCVS